MTKEYIPEDQWVETYTGKKFYFSAPTAHMIDIVDIAHALSNLCRYNGHTSSFYSVAEHCILLCSKYVEENPDDITTARAMLLHDASEAYMCDMPSPIKHSMPQFRDMESRIEPVIFAKYGVPNPLPRIVKEWDKRICLDERAQLMSSSGHTWDVDVLPALGVTVRRFAPGAAADNFLTWFKAVS